MCFVVRRDCALRARKFRHPAKFGTPARRGAKGTGYGAAPRHSDAKPRSAVFGPLSAALPPSGKARLSVVDGAAKPRPAPDFRSYWLSQYSVWCCAPSSAPSATPLGVSITVGLRGHASAAAGASFPRCARSGDLPPRRVNARGRFRFVQYSFHPNTADSLAGSGDDFVSFSIFSKISAITKLGLVQILPHSVPSVATMLRSIQPWSSGHITSQDNSLVIRSGSWNRLPYIRQSGAKAMVGVGRICKIRFLWPEKEAPGF